MKALLGFAMLLTLIGVAAPDTGATADGTYPWHTVAPARTLPDPSLAEDDPAWNCFLDGNRTCGPADFTIAAGCVGYDMAAWRVMCPDGSVMEMISRPATR